MPISGAQWQPGEAIKRARILPWTPREEATLARGFIDLDLDGPELYAWCLKHGVNRSAGGIDAKLAKLNFFANPPARETEEQPRMHAHHAKDRAAEAKRARENLANQIRLAKMEMDAGAPLYRPTDEDWKTA